MQGEMAKLYAVSTARVMASMSQSREVCNRSRMPARGAE